MSVHRSKLYGRLLGGVAAISLLTAFGAHAQDLTQFDIAPQPLSSALNEFATQSKMAVLFTPELTGARVSPGLTKAAEPETALAMMLQGTGLSWKRNGDTFIILSASDPQSGSAAGDGADGTVAALVVTAQKKEENIQDVPIAISAFTQKSLEEQKIEGGFDLLKAIPNVTFSKNNFTSYNFSIRGIGTKAVSATTDPGVAVSFNNVSLIQNRLFEQEYFDVERVEVLRGPQGTLYGRNATAGVINVISAKPNMTEFSGWLKGEVGNYQSKRLSAMVNLPLFEDKLAIRFAGALTDRQGYDYNTITKHAVNGRDLWSGRVTVQFNPTDRIRTNLIWERFNEDDNRSRTGKQVCHRDDGPELVGGVDPVATAYVTPTLPEVGLLRRTIFTAGCKAGSLYDSGAFGTPNGMAIPFVWAMMAFREVASLGGVIENNVWTPHILLRAADPYGGMRQSEDLRVISSIKDPTYKANADLVQLNADWDLSDTLTLSVQTVYNKDSVYSAQDYNRFNTLPIFEDTSKFVGVYGDPSPYQNLAPGGVYCDPQLGCSNRLVGYDISKAKSSQLSQEIRIYSHMDGPINFSAGANYTKFSVLADYYVFYNVMSVYPAQFPFDYQYGDRYAMNTCYTPSYDGLKNIVAGQSITFPLSPDDPNAGCPYVDPNPLESINGEGHNYFRSKNPYKLTSGAVFGELYWRLPKNVKLTAGLRYTVDKKHFVPVPTQLLLATGWAAGGDVNRGYPELPPIKQRWGEWTGRLGLDWKPDVLSGTDTLLYAFYSRGYKGGGANPPSPGFSSRSMNDWFAIYGFRSPNPKFDLPVIRSPGDYSPTFRPEFVNAFEIGSKSMFLHGALRMNSDAFFYDYKDYQVSQIRSRTAVNENFDAKIWGLEFETTFSPSRNFSLIGNFGYLDTAIANGMKSIDVMNRTQGNSNYVLAKPSPQVPSNCVVPVHVATQWLLYDSGGGFGGFAELCGNYSGVAGGSYVGIWDPQLGAPYDVANYPEINGGAGLYADLGGNELPNSPHWTANLGAQYSVDFANSWRATIRADGYWQSQSWARVYNAVNDKLHGWYNANLSLWLENDQGLKIEIYAKNILDKSPITDAFINSDDTALTTNVFTLDPRLIGLSIKKDF